MYDIPFASGVSFATDGSYQAGECEDNEHRIGYYCEYNDEHHAHCGIEIILTRFYKVLKFDWKFQAPREDTDNEQENEDFIYQ